MCSIRVFIKPKETQTPKTFEFPMQLSKIFIRFLCMHQTVSSQYNLTQNRCSLNICGPNEFNLTKIKEAIKTFESPDSVQGLK